MSARSSLPPLPRAPPTMADRLAWSYFCVSTLRLGDGRVRGDLRAITTWVAGHGSTERGPDPDVTTGIEAGVVSAFFTVNRSVRKES